MFDADIDALFDVSIPNSFVDYDSNSRFCDVVDDTGFAVIDFVGHAEETLDISHLGSMKSMYEPLLNSAIGFDVDYVTNSISSQHWFTNLSAGSGLTCIASNTSKA